MNDKELNMKTPYISQELSDYEYGYRNGYQEALKKFQWINAKERMPEKDGRYLVVEDHPSCKWVGVSTMRRGKFDMPITHWQLLPEVPNE